MCYKMFEIKSIAGKGNALIAREAIAKNCVILEEDPLVCVQFSWNEAYGYAACNHCLKPLETAEECARRLANNPDIVLPHPEFCDTNKTLFSSCSECLTQYCSEECRVAAFNQYHRILCKGSVSQHHPLDVLNEAWKQLHYPPECSSIMIIPRILATILQSRDTDAALQTFLAFAHRTANEDAQLVHKLLGDSFQSQVNTLFECMQNVVSGDAIEELRTLDGFRMLLALIGTNAQGVGTTPIGRWAKKVMNASMSDDEKRDVNGFVDTLYDDMEAHSGAFLSNEGIALYRVQAKCNHSCAPNAIASFFRNNSHLSLVALRDIKPGEEICISYLSECELERSRHSRQKKLKENYLFLCQCEKCLLEADQLDVTSDEDDEEESE